MCINFVTDRGTDKQSILDISAFRTLELCIKIQILLQNIRYSANTNTIWRRMDPERLKVRTSKVRGSILGENWHHFGSSHLLLTWRPRFQKLFHSNFYEYVSNISSHCIREFLRLEFCLFYFTRNCFCISWKRKIKKVNCWLEFSNDLVVSQCGALISR